MPHLVNAAYIPVHRADRTSAGPRAVNLTSVLPATSQLAQTLPRRTVSSAKQLNTSSTESASNAPREETLKAEMPNQKATAPQIKQPQAQQWIVLATLEQVQTTRRAIAPSSDYDSAEECTDQTASDTTGKPNAQTVRPKHSQPGTQITVTRLIFRVIPINSRLNQPVPMPIRAGWLVFQL
jgi:hypothetical protein